MKSSGISSEEWLLELQRISSHSDEGFTAKEWSEKLGLSTRVTLERLKLAHSKGWVRVGRRTTSRLDGRQNQTPVYRIDTSRPGTARRG